MTTARRGPLDGVKVVEFATVIMAPYASQRLADLGADVIKVESAEGDVNRLYAGGDHPQLSNMVLNLHRGKRSISLDLRRPRGLDAMHRLVASADVLLTNVRPGSLGRLGLSHSQLAERCPRLIVCDAHGFREETGDADQPAFDDIIQAMTGTTDLMGRVAPEPRFLPMLLADKLVGLEMVCGVLAALVERNVTGRGQRVEVSMFDALLAFNLVEHLAEATIPGGKAGYTRAFASTRGPHRTSDGWIAMMPHTDDQWRQLFEAAEAAHFLENPWQSGMKERIADSERAYGDLQQAVATRTTDEWLAITSRIGVAAAKVISLDEIIADAAAHRGVLIDEVHPEVGPYRSIGAPASYSDHPTSMRTHRPTPLVGADGVQILTELGMSVPEVEDLIADQSLTAP